MIFGDVDIEIVEAFSKNLVAFYSINQIAKLLKKTYPYVNKRVSYLIEQGILKKSVLGSSHLCSLNLANDKCIVLLSLVEIKKRDRFLKRNSKLRGALELLKKETSKRTFHCILLNKGKIIFVLEDPLYSIVIQGFQSTVVGKKEFLDLLLNSDVLQDHVIVHGFEKYFEFVKEIEKELRLKNMSI